MDADLKWVIGIATTLSVAFVAALIAAFRALASRISYHVSDLHGRVDDVKEKYVRRDDLDGHLGRIDRSLQETRDEMHENHRQILEELRRRG